MKKIITIVALSISLIGCSLPTAMDTNDKKTYSTNEFSFEYPSEWSEENGQFFTSDKKEIASVYDGDVMGPRCTEILNNNSFTDVSKRTWSYSVEAIDADCSPDNGFQMTDQRMFLADIGQQKSGFLALLFYEYDVKDEQKALEEFQSILNSVVKK